MESSKMNLKEVLKKLEEEKITNEEQRRFIIDSIYMLPAHEIVVLIGYLKMGWNIQQLKKQVVPIMEHIDEQPVKNNRRRKINI